MARKLKVILFGAGLVGRQALPRYLETAEVLALADNDVSKYGSKVLGVTVIRPDRIASIDFDQVIITSTSTGQIFDQLVELGIPKECIKIAGEADCMLMRRFPWDAVLFFLIVLFGSVLLMVWLLRWLFG